MVSLLGRVGAFASVVLLLAACGDAPQASDSTAPPEASASQPSSPAAEANVDDAVAALQVAADEFAEGRPFDIEREREDGREVWEIKVASDGQEYSLQVSLDGSQVLNRYHHDTPDDDVQKVGQAQVDIVTALTAAADSIGGRLDEMEIDTRDDGTLVWEVELVQDDGTVTEVDVDATSGQVLR